MDVIKMLQKHFLNKIAFYRIYFDQIIFPLPITLRCFSPATNPIFSSFHIHSFKHSPVLLFHLSQLCKIKMKKKGKEIKN